MGSNRKLSTAEVSAAVERAFARQEGREQKSIRTDNPVIGELASLDTLEYELQRDTAAAGLGIRVSALDKLVKGRRAATEDENAALPHWNVEPSAELVDGAALLNNLRQVFRRYVVLPKGADIALPLWVLHTPDEQRASARLDNLCEGGTEFTCGSYEQDLPPDGTTCRLHVSQRDLGFRSVWI